MIARRTLLEAALLLPALSLGAGPLIAATGSGFTHSVASGDPATNSVVLWTRFVPAGGGEATVRFEVSADDRFRSVVARGTASSTPATDYCAQAIAGDLKPGRWYYYRFVAPNGQSSPVGRTRTLPEGSIASFRIGVVGCANATSGWFNAYAHAAARDDLDLIVHTGDYIYESPVDRSDALVELAVSRNVQPKGEAITLADYRMRYASYRLDPALMELHRRYPMIVMWDDHEVANNSWQNGAKNHRPEDGPWDVRKAAGVRAFREWLPMRGSDYASYQVGDLATLFRLETRLLARSEPLDVSSIARSPDRAAAIKAFITGPLADPARTMMGASQERWLAQGFSASSAASTRWQVIAQQVVMGQSRLPPVSAAWYAPGQLPDQREVAELRFAELLGKAGVPTALDRWVGYPAARSRLLDSAAQAKANLVVLSGDSHNAWAYDLMQGGRPVGVEFAGQSVSSLGIEKRFGGAPDTIAADFIHNNSELKWCDTSRRGYMIVHLTRTAAHCEWLFLDSRQTTSLAMLSRHQQLSEHGSNIIVNGS
jgi:alkaline phosphatase D